MKYLIIILLIFLTPTLFGQVIPTDIPLEASPDSSNFEVYSRKSGIETRANLDNMRKYYNPIDTIYVLQDSIIKFVFADGSTLQDTISGVGGATTNTNLATDDLTQAAEDRTYTVGGYDLNFLNADTILLDGNIAKLQNDGASLTMDTDGFFHWVDFQGAYMKVSNNSSSNAGKIQIYEGSDNGTQNVSIAAPQSLGTSYTLFLPPDDGDTNEFLQSDGGGNLTFEPVDLSTDVTGSITESQISDLVHTTNTDTQDLSIDSVGRVFTISLVDGGNVKFEDTGGDNQTLTFLNDSLFLSGNPDTVDLTSLAGISIGDLVGSAIDGSILFIDNSSQLTQDNTNFNYDGALFQAGNFIFDIDQTLGASQDGYILTYDDGTGQMSFIESVGDNLGNHIPLMDIIPDANNAYDLGGSSFLFDEVYSGDFLTTLMKYGTLGMNMPAFGDTYSQIQYQVNAGLTTWWDYQSGENTSDGGKHFFEVDGVEQFTITDDNIATPNYTNTGTASKWWAMDASGNWILEDPPSAVSTVDTLTNYAALRAYTTASNIVFVQNPSGLFRQVASGTDDDGITIVGSDARIWRRPVEDVIDVRWFGAVADGVTDDQNAIQAAIDATDGYNNTVYIPAGVYFVDTLIHIQKSGVTVYGDGDSTELLIANPHTVIAGGLNGIIGAYGASGDTLTNVTIRDLAVNGNDNNKTQLINGSMLTYTKYSKIENVKVIGITNYGLWAAHSKYGKIINCHVTGAEESIELSQGVDHFIVDGNVVEGNSDTNNMILLYGNTDNAILSNNILRGLGNGINVSSSTNGCSNITMDGNNIWVEDNGAAAKYAISMDANNYGDENFVITGGNLYAEDQPTIKIGGSIDGVNISGVYMEAPSGHGITYGGTGTINVVIDGNTIRASGGIDSGTISHSIISNNKIESSGVGRIGSSNGSYLTITGNSINQGVISVADYSTAIGNTLEGTAAYNLEVYDSCVVTGNILKNNRSIIVYGEGSTITGNYLEGSGTINDAASSGGNLIMINDGGALRLTEYTAAGSFPITAVGSLVFDNTGKIGTQAIAAGGVTGTGTANYIPKWTSTSVIGNSILFDDGTNVGIGDATPSYKLDINGDLNITSSSKIYLGDADSYFSAPSAGSIRWTSNGTIAFTSTNDQDFIVGTADWGEDLNVTGNAFISSKVMFGNSGWNEYSIGHTGGETGYMKLLAGGAVRMIIDDTGNVGIGTDTSPDAILDVQGGTQTILGNYIFNHDQTVSATEDNYVLTYDDGTGEIGLEAGGSGADGDGIYDGSGTLSGNTTVSAGGYFLDINVATTIAADGDNYLDITTSKILNYTDFVEVNGSTGNESEIRFLDDANSDYTGLRSNDDVTESGSYILPPADGAANTILETDGSFGLSWGASPYKTWGFMSFSDSTLTVTTSIAGTSYVITNATNTLFGNELDEGDVTIQGDSILINTTDYYNIEFTFSFDVSSAASTYELGAIKITSEIPSTIAGMKAEVDFPSTDTNNISYQIRKQFTTGDIIKPIVIRTVGAGSPTFITGSVSIDKLD